MPPPRLSSPSPPVFFLFLLVQTPRPIQQKLLITTIKTWRFPIREIHPCLMRCSHEPAPPLDDATVWIIAANGNDVELRSIRFASCPPGTATPPTICTSAAAAAEPIAGTAIGCRARSCAAARPACDVDVVVVDDPSSAFRVRPARSSALATLRLCSRTHTAPRQHAQQRHQDLNQPSGQGSSNAGAGAAFGCATAAT